MRLTSRDYFHTWVDDKEESSIHAASTCGLTGEWVCQEAARLKAQHEKEEAVQREAMEDIGVPAFPQGCPLTDS